MTPYVPHTVWVATAPQTRAAPPRAKKREYKMGSASWAARQVLEYTRTYPGSKSTEIRDALKLSSISRQLKHLTADNLVTVTLHKNIAGMPLMRCWPTDPPA